MPQDNYEEEDVLFKWGFPDFTKYRRGRLWYVVATLIFIILITYSIFTVNFLFGIIIVMSTIILFIQERNGPQESECVITFEGVYIGNKLHPFKSIKNFYIIYEPPTIKNLYIEFKSVFQPRLQIPLEDQNPADIRNALLEYIEEDINKEYEPLSEKISRFLKL